MAAPSLPSVLIPVEVAVVVAVSLLLVVATGAPVLGASFPEVVLASPATATAPRRDARIRRACRARPLVTAGGHGPGGVVPTDGGDAPVNGAMAVDARVPAPLHTHVDRHPHSPS